MVLTDVGLERSREGSLDVRFSELRGEPERPICAVIIDAAVFKLICKFVAQLVSSGRRSEVIQKPLMLVAQVIGLVSAAASWDGTIRAVLSMKRLYWRVWEEGAVLTPPAVVSRAGTALLRA